MHFPFKLGTSSPTHWLQVVPSYCSGHRQTGILSTVSQIPPFRHLIHTQCLTVSLKGSQCVGADVPCLNGKCIFQSDITFSKQNGTKNSTIPRCECDEGFQGPQCQYRTCDIYGPCKNGGICVDIVDPNDDRRPHWETIHGATCQCKEEFSGPFCEVARCDNYCKNGGVPSFNPQLQPQKCSCDCPPGTAGERCEQTNCTQLKCWYGGKCILLNTYEQSSESGKLREVCNCTSRYDNFLFSVPIILILNHFHQYQNLNQSAVLKKVTETENGRKVSVKPVRNSFVFFLSIGEKKRFTL